MNNDDLIANYESLDLKKLDPVIHKNGFVYKLIKRTNKKLMYAQCNSEGKIYSYEVFKNKIKPYREMQIKLAARFQKDEKFDPSIFPEYYEVFPSDEEFGKRAWSYLTLEKANRMFAYG